MSTPTSCDEPGAPLGGALFLLGFRPFFLGGALWAALATPLWVAALSGHTPAGFAVDSFDWHRHEMIFGWLSAIIAGFLLTAVPNWTGRPALTGGRLMALSGLWLAGRLGLTLGGLVADGPAVLWPATLLAAAFPLVMAGLTWREVIGGGNRRNFPVAALITLYAVGDIVFLLGAAGVADSTAMGARIGLAAVAMLIALIGGRVTPAFTRNWLVKQGPGALPAEFDRLDKIGMGMVGAALLAWLIAPGAVVSGFAMIIAAAVTAARLSRWAGRRTLGEPLVAALHVAYGFLALGFFAIGLDILRPGYLAGLHGLTVGAVGLMTLAIMTRATLGHTGRPLHADGWTVAIYGLVALAALLRLPAPWAAGAYTPLIHASATAWSLGFGLYVLIYGPLLWRRQAAPSI